MRLSKTMHICQKKKKFWLRLGLLQLEEGFYRSKVISKMKLLTCRFKSG